MIWYRCRINATIRQWKRTGMEFGVVVVRSLVIEAMLEGTFSQIGQVLGAEVERVGCGWVEF